MGDYPEIYKPVTRLKDKDAITKWVKDNYFRLDSGGIDRLGSEPNTVPYSEDTWKGAPLRVLIVRWSDYFSVDVSFSHGIVNQMIKEFMPGAYVDFSFFPSSPKDFSTYVTEKIPLMFGNTSKRPAAEFDVIMVSHCVTNEGLNWPAILKYSGFPLFKNERMEREDLPLIFMGGANAFCNESLYGGWSLEDKENTCMIDATFVGEGEKILPKLLKVYVDCKKKEMDKKAILKEFHLKKIPGYYEASEYEHVYGKPDWHGKFGKCDYLLEINPKNDWVRPIVKKAKVMDLDSVRSIEEDLIPYTGAGEAQCQIAAGCNCACSFCQEAAVNVPYRERSAENIIRSIKTARVNQGSSSASWFAFNWNTHSQIHTITRAAMQEFGDIGLISMRIDTLAEHEGLAHLLKFVGNKSQTMGVEGCSQRIRDFLHKSVSTHDLLTGSEYLIRNGCSEMKFFMIATGQEIDSDIQEFVLIMKEINEIKKKYNSKCQTRVSFMPIYNCCSGDTEIVTREGFRKLEDLTGQTVELLAKDGKWRESKINYFGSRQLNKVIFKPLVGKSNFRMEHRVTANHRWFLSDGSVTESLKVGDKVKIEPVVPTDLEKLEQDYIDGFTHGLVFGDGSKHISKNGFTHHIRLCASKDKLLKPLLVKATCYHATTFPDSLDGDPCVHFKITSSNWKEVPKSDPGSMPGGFVRSESTPLYQAGFIRGWLAADGNKNNTSKRDSYVLQSTSHEAVQWVVDRAPMLGFCVTGDNFESTEVTNFGPRTRLIRRVSLTEQSMEYRVQSIEEDMIEPVYCPEEPVTTGFTLKGGMVTGNCAFTALQFYACESFYKLNQDSLRPLVEACRELRWGFRTGSKRSEIMISQLNEMTDRRTTPLLIKNSLGDPEMLAASKTEREQLLKEYETFKRENPTDREGQREVQGRLAFAEAKVKYSDGWCFAGLVPKLVDKVWEERIKNLGLDLDYYFCEKDMDYVFPWDIIDISVTKEYTYEKWLQAKAFFDPGYCVGTLTKTGKCFSCSGCPTPSHTAWMTQREVEAPNSVANLEAFDRDMTKRGILRFKCNIKLPEMRTVKKKFYGKVLARALMMADPEKWSPIYLDTNGNSRTTASTNDKKDWVYGQILVDMAFNKQVTTDEIKPYIEEMNKNLHGLEILDVKGYAAEGCKTLFSAVDNALYHLFVPNDGLPFREITKRVDAFRKKRDSGEGFTIKTKEIKMKGVFKTVMKDLDIKRIKYVGCRQGFDDKGRNGTELVMLADNKINPFDLMEALLGGKSFQYRKYEAKVLGYYTEGTTQVVDLFSDIDDDAAVSSACEKTGLPVEVDSFSWEPYQSVSDPGLCISADYDLAMSDRKVIPQVNIEIEGPKEKDGDTLEGLL